MRYVLRQTPVVVYACHCTDCQTESGTAFYLAIVALAGAVEYVHGEPQPWHVKLPDGREKRALHCSVCSVTVGGEPREDGLQSLHAGTLDEASWVRPAGHIWTRSALPWIRFPEEDVVVEEQPKPADWNEILRVWSARAGSSKGIA